MCRRVRPKWRSREEEGLGRGWFYLSDYGIPRTYIRAAGYEANALDEAAERVKTDSSWTYIDVPYGHDVMLIASEALTELLLSVA